jgi:protein-disulfide isomerase
VLRTEPQLMSEFVSTGQVRLGFHHILDHGQASEYASMATECAGEQSPTQFWTMHDLLFSSQSQLFRADKATYNAFASQIGLDVAAFGTCMANDTHLAKVRAMNDERVSEWSIRRRPSFVINGKVYEGGIPFNAFEIAIQEAIG